ncbi:MAG: hypothetical protein JSV04_12980 [Candidatus Heimdallarchaeota archaeon]|nr:MAG: hypothetical protein JSV04_12980 [Candidatus Heimdallarchaeota archaeon]
MYSSRIISFTLLLLVTGTAWSMFFSLSFTGDNYPIPESVQVNDSFPELSILNLPQNWINSQIRYITTPVSRIEQVPGETKSFWVYNIRDDEYEQITVTLKVVGLYSLIYSNLSPTVAPDSVFLEMKDTFETTIYPQLTEFFGSPPDIDDNSKIIILVIDIIDGYTGGLYVAGFFDPRHQYLDETWSNEAEILHIDKLGVDDFEIVAHEFQHMIHFGKDNEEHIWLDEGAAVFAEYLIGIDPFSGSSAYKEDFSANPDVSLTYWDYDDSEGLVMANYGASYAFFLYLCEQYGGASTIRTIVNSSEHGIKSIENVLNAQGYSVEFKEVFRNWTIANFLDDPSIANGDYGYYNTSLSMSVERTSPASSVPRVENTVPYWGTDYLKFTNRLGLPFNLEFQGDINSDFMVTAILTNTSLPMNTKVIPVKISDDEFGNFSLEETGITADQVVLAISAYTPPGKNDHDDFYPSPLQKYWFMVNPQEMVISPGNLSFTNEDLYIWNVKVSDQHGYNWQEADGATYTIITESGTSTGVTGNLIFNSDSNFWESDPIDISVLPLDNTTYRVKYHFFNSTCSGIAYSEAFQIANETSSESSSTTTEGPTTGGIISFPGLLLVLSILAIGSLIVSRNKK